MVAKVATRPRLSAMEPKHRRPQCANAECHGEEQAEGHIALTGCNNVGQVSGQDNAVGMAEDALDDQQATDRQRCCHANSQEEQCKETRSSICQVQNRAAALTVRQPAKQEWTKDAADQQARVQDVDRCGVKAKVAIEIERQVGVERSQSTPGRTDHRRQHDEQDRAIAQQPAHQHARRLRLAVPRFAVFLSLFDQRDQGNGQQEGRHRQNEQRPAPTNGSDEHGAGNGHNHGADVAADHV